MRTIFVHDDGAAHLTFTSSRGYAAVQPDWLLEAAGASSKDKSAQPGERKRISLLSRIDDSTRFVDSDQYALVKLATMFVMRGLLELAENDDEGKKVIVNAACPGLCKTDLGRDFPAIAKVFMAPFHAVLARTAEQGSRTLVGATALGEESKGRLWSNDHFIE